MPNLAVGALSACSSAACRKLVRHRDGLGTRVTAPLRWDSFAGRYFRAVCHRFAARSGNPRRGRRVSDPVLRRPFWLAIGGRPIQRYRAIGRRSCYRGCRYAFHGLSLTVTAPINEVT